MSDELLNLRNGLHEDEFRFHLTPSLWESHYVSEKELNANNVVRVIKNGILRGYAVYSILISDQIKTCRIEEICADGKAILNELIDRIIRKSTAKGVDFIFLRRCEEPYNDLFDERGFLSIIESAIMVVLLDPIELLLSISKKIERGKILKLIVRGFDPIKVKVGEKGVMVVKDKKYDLTVRTDSRTFLKLFFGKTSLIKEFLRRKIIIDQIFYLPTISRFFNLIKQRRWYIPPGDWI